MVVTENIAMEDIDLSEDDSTDEEIDRKEKSKSHKKLLKDIGFSSGKKRKSTRNEPSQEVSEYSWSTGQGQSNKLELHELVGSLTSTTQPVSKIKKKLRKMENTTKVLDKPLTKPETQRIERTVAYQDTSNEISKWNPIVQKNREAEQLTFPMNQYQPPTMSTKALVTNFQPQNDLEREISAVLQGSKQILERNNKELTEAEETALKSFDLQDALERRKELQRSRALQSYYEAKCRRMKKIKSKKYHRIMKKEQQRALGKVDLETLAVENPELFQSELQKAEKMRALERANLRHRNTSKWAKNMIIKGHKTKEDQEVVREQLRISRQLTDHKTIEESDDEVIENENENQDETQLNLLAKQNTSDNPWLLGKSSNSVTESKENNDSSKLYKKLKPIVTKESSKFHDDDEDDNDVQSSGDEWQQKDNVCKTKKRTSKKVKVKKTKLLKCTAAEDDTKENDNDPIDIESDQEYEGVSKLDTQDTPKKIEPKKLKEEKAKRKTKQSDTMRFLKNDTDALELNFEGGEDSSDDEDIVYDTEQRMNIREAFANDDVIADFEQEKSDILEQSKPKALDLTLPGWGEWAGAGLTVSKKKRKQFTKDVGPGKKRKDENMSNVIISEMRNKKLAKHQVSEVPFPYSNKAEYERSIRQPIGEQWNTPSVHNKLTEPRIRTLPGVNINPLKPSKKLKKKMKSSKPL